MSETNKGVLIYNEWFEAMESLTPKEYKCLLSAAYRYQIHGDPPPQFKGKAQIIAAVIFPYIERRKKQAVRGKLGIEARLSKTSDTHLNDGDGCDPVGSTADSTVGSTVDSTAGSTAGSQRIEEYRIAENSIKEHTIEERSVPQAYADVGADANANAEKEKKSAFGIYKNVYLSRDEYQAIQNTVTDADGYIDKFSKKLHDKGYRYADHAGAILEWWRRDKHLEENQGASTDTHKPTQDSFDTDSFFEAAVRRSLGEGYFGI